MIVISAITSDKFYYCIDLKDELETCPKKGTIYEYHGEDQLIRLKVEDYILEKECDEKVTVKDTKTASQKEVNPLIIRKAK